MATFTLLLVILLAALKSHLSTGGEHLLLRAFFYTKTCFKYSNFFNQLASKISPTIKTLYLKYFFNQPVLNFFPKVKKKT